MKSLQKAALVVLIAVLLTMPLGGQNVELKSESDQNLNALSGVRVTLLKYATDPFDFVDRMTSPIPLRSKQ